MKEKNNREIKFSHKYFFEPSPKKMLKVALIIRAVCGVVGTSYIANDYKHIGLLILVAGAVSNEIINCFKE